MNILVTGATGFIASHTIVELQQSGHNIIGVDNLSNSVAENVDKIAQITGIKIDFHQADICDYDALKMALADKHIDCCIHFAGLKAVGESVSKPLEYYENNISGAIVLLQTMRKYNVKKFIFSSSATVYGDPEIVPITEKCKTGGTTNPYGTTKLIIEGILQDLHKVHPEMNICLLRYFEGR